MKPKTPDWVYAKNRTILERTEIFRQITEQLQSIHSEGNVHGGLTPSHVNPNENSIIKPNASLADESLFEWRPAEERNLAKNSNEESKPTKEGDIFNLGCFFYCITTRGQHPFGGSGQRVSFIANNLYDLSACRDKQFQKLITKMISHDFTQRPTCSELLHHPYLWKSEEIEKYLYEIADNIDESSNQYLKWKDHFLLPSSQPSPVKSVAEILADIKKKQEAPLNACNMFPDLLSSVFFTDNPESGIQKEISDEFCPITFQNLLIANASFGELGPFKKRNGRFGLQPVHVMEFSQTSTDISEESLFLMKRLACLSHPNMLKYFYVGENSEGISCERSIILACEPFDETLETLSKNSLDFETAKDILNQTTAGLLNYHSNNLVHGDITSSQIAIFNNSDNTIAKICKFPVHDKTGSPSMPNDIRMMGHIYRDLFKRVGDVPPLCHHLIQSMIGTRDERVPPCEAVFYHPLFWSPGEVTDFLLVVGDFYKDNPTIDRNSNLEPNRNGNLKQEFQHLKTNRSAIEYFLSYSTEAKEEATEALAVTLTTQYPMLLIQTWLKLQKYKSMDCGLDLDPFYYPTYDFPTYDELSDVEELTLQDDLAMCNSTMDQEDQSQEKVCWEIEMLPDSEDEGHTEAEFVIDSFFIPSYQERQFNQSSNEVSSGADHPIQCYLSNYVQKWEIAEKDNPGKIKKHPIIDQFGRTAMHLACHSDDFYELAEKLSHLGSAKPNVRDKNGYAPLHVAAKTNAIRITQLLVRMNATIDISAKYSFTPLFFAVLSKSTPTIKLLIKNRADVTKMDHFGRSPLHFAVATNSIENIDLLLNSMKSSESLCKLVDAVDQEGRSALHIAVANQSIAMMEYLLKKYNANPNVGKLDGTESKIIQEKKRPVLQLAIGMQLYEVVDSLLKAGADPNFANFNGQTSLHVAALQPPGQNRLAIVDRLITNKDKRANVNAVDKMGRTVLHAATLNQAEDIVQRLLECQPHIEVDRKESQRSLTPLHLAGWGNLKIIAKLLIKKGKARIDAKDMNGDTPLEYAASSNAIDVAEELLKESQETEVPLAKTKRWNGRSPLHVAAAHGAIQVGKLLISMGADINARDSLGLTPHHYAEYRGHSQFVNLLKENSSCSPDLVSLPLNAIDLKSIRSLTNGFKSNYAPQIQIMLPTIEAQFNQLKLQVTQELIIDGFQSNQ